MTPYHHDDGPGRRPGPGVDSVSVDASPRALRRAVTAVACLTMVGATCVIVDRVATLVSLTLTPLVIEDGLVGWDGRSEQVPCNGYAVLFGRSVAAHLPEDLPTELALTEQTRKFVAITR